MSVPKSNSLAFSLLLLCVLMVSTLSCSPKKEKMYRQSFPKTVYAVSTDSLPFRFDLSNQAKLTWQQNNSNEYFCDIDYPLLQARIYCTFHTIEKNRFSVFAEESRKLAYQHTVVATAINEQVYANDRSNVYGILYDIKGNVATPLQVALTDSNHYFFNASLYFNKTPNTDSIAPMVSYIRKDIVRMMETFTTKKQK